MKTLNEIGLEQKTDKSTITHCYLETYEHYLKEWRDKEFVMWEIGVAGGASLRMWREYFPKARIIGIDINSDCEKEGDVFIGSQTDFTFLDSVIEKTGIPDIIVSDGSHVGDEEVLTWKHLFPKMKSGSIFLLEDTSTFFNNHYSGEFEQNGRTRAYNFFTDLVYHVEVAGRGCCGNQDFCIDHPSTDPPVPEFSRVLKSVHFYTGLYVFLRK